MWGPTGAVRLATAPPREAPNPMRTRRRATITDLRRAIDGLPRRHPGGDARRDPQQRHHRRRLHRLATGSARCWPPTAGARKTSHIAFAKAWDLFALGGARDRARAAGHPARAAGAERAPRGQPARGGRGRRRTSAGARSPSTGSLLASRERRDDCGASRRPGDPIACELAHRPGLGRGPRRTPLRRLRACARAPRGASRRDRTRDDDHAARGR